MRPEAQDPTLTDDGWQEHPAFGMIAAHRISAQPGAVLFDSDIRHNYFIRVTISTATRKRDLNRDWLHGDRQLIEVEMSEAQWASFVSAMNTSGVPCTLARTEDGDRPGLTYAPRLAESIQEVHNAAEDAFAEIREAFAAYEASIAGASAADRRKALHTLGAKISNATPNVDYAGKALSEHAENIVQRSRADIEAMVLSHGGQLGIDVAPLLALETAEGIDHEN